MFIILFFFSIQRKATGGVEVALDASELEGLTDAELRVKLAEASKRSRGTHEDFSDLVEEEVAKRRKTGKLILHDSFLKSVEADCCFYFIADAKKRDNGKEKFKF